MLTPHTPTSVDTRIDNPHATPPSTNLLQILEQKFENHAQVATLLEAILKVKPQVTERDLRESIFAFYAHGAGSAKPDTPLSTMLDTQGPDWLANELVASLRTAQTRLDDGEDD